MTPTTLKLLSMILLLVILPAIFFSFLQSLFFVPAAAISYEIIALPIAAIALRSHWVTLIYLTLLLIHTLFSVAPAYHLSMESAGVWLISILDLSYLVQGAIALIIALFAALAYVASMQIGHNDQTKRHSLSVVFLLLALALITDRFVEPAVGRNYVNSDLLSTFQMVRNVNREAMATDNSNRGQLRKVESATGPLFDLFANDSALPSKVLLVVTESLGLGDKETNRLQYQSLIESSHIINSHSVSYSKTPFLGSTVPAEYRELCGRFTKTPAFSTPLEVRPECLPNLFRERGYQASALHGFGGGFFDRIRWYKELGFEQRYFANQLRTQFNLQRTCGHLIFEGLCDSDIARIISDRLLVDGEKQFLYWLTLNGHQPTLGNPGVGQYQPCASMQLAEKPSCWTVQHAQVVVNSVLDIVKASPELAVIIVGDHSPGGYNGAFNSDYVPAITIWPKKL